MKIVFTPDWFLGTDFLIETFSFLVLLAFFILSFRNYKLNNNKKTLYLGVGFLLIAIAELFTIMTKWVLYYDTTIIQEIGKVILASHVVKSVDIFYYIGFFIHKLFTLSGFYIIYRLPLAKKTPGDLVLGIYFIIISAVFSQVFYYLFHLTAFLLLIMILFNYIEIYQKNKSKNTKILIIAFGMLAFSQLIFILSQINVLYVIAQIIQLISYIILFVLIVKIKKYGKETKPYGYNIRYAGNDTGKGRKD